MIKKVNFKQGSSEYIAFVLIAPILCAIVVMLSAYIQLYNQLGEINNAVSVCGRSVALCTNIEDAKEQALRVAETSIRNDNISNISVDVEMIDEGSEWQGGSLVLVTVKCYCNTVAPYLVSKEQSESVVVSVENTSVSNDELNLLASIIACEDDTCVEGGMAVGSVIMNRVENPGYGNTLSEVIYQSGQFEPTFPGHDTKFLNYLNNGAPLASVEIARRILNGERHPFIEEHNIMHFKASSINSFSGFTKSRQIGGNRYWWN